MPYGHVNNAPQHYSGRHIMKPSFLAMLLVFCTTTTLQAERPNVIVIMTDDQGIGDFGFAAISPRSFSQAVRRFADRYPAVPHV